MVTTPAPRRRRRRSPTPYPDLATLLRDRRVHLGLTQGFVAERVGINQTTLSCWERGERVPSGPLLMQLVTYLGIERDELAAATKKPA